MTPVAAAVAPIKADAIAHAETYATKTVARIRAELEEANWDIELVAPYPRTYAHDYHGAKSRRLMFDAVTKWTVASHRPGTPLFVTMPDKLVENFIRQNKEAAAAQYDLFVMKLEGKVGAHTAARLEGNHVWGWSHLYVETEAGTQVWKTQQILNVSKLGKVFPQWPSRKVGKGSR